MKDLFTSLKAFQADVDPRNRSQSKLWALASHPDLNLPGHETAEEKFEFLKTSVEAYLRSQMD